MDILFSGEFASLAGLDEEALKAQLQTEDGQLKADAAKIFSNLVLDKFKTQERTAKEQQYNRGIREAKEAAERAAKPLFQKYGVDAAMFEDAIQELSEKLGQAGTPSGDPQELTKEQIAKHPAFKELLEGHTNDIVAKWKQKHEAAIQEYEQFKASTTREKVANAVMSKTRQALEADGRQPIYGTKGPEEALKQFWGYHGFAHIRLAEDGQPELLDKDGNILRDEMSNPVSFDKFIESNWILGFKDAAGNGSPPHGGRSGGSNAPLRQSDFKARMEAAKTPAERAELLKQMAEKMRKPEN